MKVVSVFSSMFLARSEVDRRPCPTPPFPPFFLFFFFRQDATPHGLLLGNPAHGRRQISAILFFHEPQRTRGSSEATEASPWTPLSFFLLLRSRRAFSAVLVEKAHRYDQTLRRRRSFSPSPPSSAAGEIAPSFFSQKNEKRPPPPLSPLFLSLLLRSRQQRGRCDESLFVWRW